MGGILNCISISYKKADVEIRKHFAFSGNIVKNILSDFINNGFSQCVLICTCNRTEAYFCGDDFESALKILADYGKVSRETLSTCVMQFEGDKALLHLFKVACGIDSMVVGEDEILGQTKNAFALATQCKTVSYEFNMIFKSAVTCAKKIKTETALSKTSVSTATLAANEAAKLGENVKVLVIGGTGKIGSTVLKNLVSHKNVTVMTTLRSHCGNLNIVENSPKICTINYDERYEYDDCADCIISATSSPHYTITGKELKKHLKTPKNRLFIDLAVPPDIDRSAANLEGVKLIGIDYFEKLAHENNAVKLDSVEAAKTIISEEIDLLKKEMDFHGFLPFVDNVKNIAQNDFEKVLYKLKCDLNAQQFSAVLKSLENLGRDV